MAGNLLRMSSMGMATPFPFARGPVGTAAPCPSSSSSLSEASINSLMSSASGGCGGAGAGAGAGFCTGSCGWTSIGAGTCPWPEPGAGALSCMASGGPDLFGSSCPGRRVSMPSGPRCTRPAGVARPENSCSGTGVSFSLCTESTRAAWPGVICPAGPARPVGVWPKNPFSSSPLSSPDSDPDRDLDRDRGRDPLFPRVGLASWSLTSSPERFGWSSTPSSRVAGFRRRVPSFCPGV